MNNPRAPLSPQLDEVSGNRSTMMAWLQLMRLPTVFTALSNILCGFLITHRVPQIKVAELTAQKELWLLLLSTSGFILVAWCSMMSSMQSWMLRSVPSDQFRPDGFHFDPRRSLVAC